MLKLYPPRWQRRYGDEFADLIGQQRFSLRTAIDVIGGAIDAWTQPQSHLSSRGSSSSLEGETIMLARIMRLQCAGHGAKVTPVDVFKGVAVTIGGTLLSVLVVLWMRQAGVNRAYSTTLSVNGWLIAYVVSMRYTTLKGWPARTQAVFIILLAGAIAAITLAAAWATAR
jgi:hypothetical protein